MKNIFLENKSYIASFLAIVICSFSLNLCTKIYQCSLLFSIIMITSLFILNNYNAKTSYTTLFTALIISGLFSYNMEYKLSGNILSGLIATSLLSVFLSFLASSIMLSNIKSNIFVKSFLIAMSASLMDGIIMSGYFINKFSTERIFSIFIEEVSFKALYLSVALVVSYGIYAINNSIKVKSL